MQTTPISRSLVMLGTIILIVTVIVIAILVLTGNPVLVSVATLLVTLFSFYHGVKRYGVSAMVFFVAMMLVISWCYETLSILTGFPFGHYFYTELLGPKIGLVPGIIMPAYFAVGYLSWTIASVLIGKHDNGISGSEIWLLPILSSVVMVMWDLCLDPSNATIGGFWVWQNGGVYFGVPFVNYLGWLLCVFTFYFVFALYLRATKSAASMTAITTRGFWVLPILMYASGTIQYWGNWLLRGSTEITDKAGHVWHTGDIYGSVVLISLFTMVFVCFLGVVLIARDSSLEAAR